MIIDNYKDIRRRMLGELKPEPVPAAEPGCRFCLGAGWLRDTFGPPVVCSICLNPKGLPCP